MLVDLGKTRRGAKVFVFVLLHPDARFPYDDVFARRKAFVLRQYT